MFALTVVISVLVFLDVLILVSALISESPDMRINRRRKYIPDQQTRSSVAARLATPFVERVARPTAGRVVHFVASRTPANTIADTNLQLARAGHPFGFTAETYITFRVLSALAGLGIAYWIWSGPMAGSIYRLPVAGFVVIVGLLAPLYIVQKSIEKRHADIRKTLPDIIDLLVVSVEAGAGLDGALTEVLDRREGVLADEFGALLREMRVGKSRKDAWSDMARRVGEESLSALVAALVQAEELGVSIGKALRAQSETVRIRRGLQIREMAATLPVKMLFPLVLFIFPALFVVLLGPGLLAMTGILDILGGQ